MDLLTVARMMVTGVALMTPSASSFTQRSELCYTIRGTVDSNGVSATLAGYEINGCIAYVDNGVHRCATNGRHLHLENTRAVPIAWRSFATYDVQGILNPGAELNEFLLHSEEGKETPPADVEVMFCK